MNSFLVTTILALTGIGFADPASETEPTQE